MNRQLKLEIKGNIYDVNYPNTGQQIDIELLKAKISDGNYDILRFSSNSMFQQQADKIDMISTFAVLVPQLKKDINVDSLFKLEEEVSDELLAIYTKQFLPWYVQLKQFIRNPKQQIANLEEEKDSLSTQDLPV